MNARLAPETYILAGIAAVDMYATWLIFSTGYAHEGNPIMDFYMKRGLGWMIAGKSAFILPQLFILEWGRQTHPVLVRKLSRLVIVVYAILLAYATPESEWGRYRHCTLVSLRKQLVLNSQIPQKEPSTSKIHEYDPRFLTPGNP